MRKTIALSFLALLPSVALADKHSKDEPHLAYGPNDTMKLELEQKELPKEFRICAVGDSFTFCTPTQHPKTREIEIDTVIPANTPEGEYHLVYEDKKGRVDLHRHFQVEK